jgi:hypothetical protein
VGLVFLIFICWHRLEREGLVRIGEPIVSKKVPLSILKVNLPAHRGGFPGTQWRVESGQTKSHLYCAPRPAYLPTSSQARRGLRGTCRSNCEDYIFELLEGKRLKLVKRKFQEGGVQKGIS